MRCTHPTKFPNSGGRYVRCGQCMSCRVTRFQELRTKLMLEYRTFPNSVFATLTYSPEYLPTEDGKYPNGNLSKEVAQKFLKRFRFNYQTATASQSSNAKTKVRYFLVGEYGTDSERAHYHVILFNVDPLLAEEIVKKSWSYGFTRTDPLNEKRISYTIGYTLKKMTNVKDFEDGRQPEFALMSRRPGLGWYALPIFAKKLKAMGLYPDKSLNSYEKFYLRSEFGCQLEYWNGLFVKDGKMYRFDTAMMKRLAQMVNPAIEKLASTAPLIRGGDKAFKAHEALLADESWIRKTKLITGGDSDEIRGKAKTIIRSSAAKRKI